MNKFLTNKTIYIEISIRFLVFIVFFLFSIITIICTKLFISVQSSMASFSEENAVLLNKISMLEKQVNDLLLTNMNTKTLAEPTLALVQNSNEQTAFTIKTAIIIVSIILSAGILYWGLCYLHTFVTNTLFYSGGSLLNYYSQMLGFTQPPAKGFIFFYKDSFNNIVKVHVPDLQHKIYGVSIKVSESPTFEPLDSFLLRHPELFQQVQNTVISSEQSAAAISRVASDDSLVTIVSNIDKFI